MPDHSPQPGSLLLGIDTCGLTGSVALGRLAGNAVEILGQTELPGRSYSATLITAIGNLLAAANATVDQLRAIVAVSGPGSFTGVRVGLSAAKGLAEGRSIGVVPVSRLEVLAAKSGIPSAAIDAHRSEVYLRVSGPNAESRELLAGADELAAIAPAPARIAICEESASAILRAVWPSAELLQFPAPTAADALTLCVPRVIAGQFADLALLDGHYLRRSDAEIFGDPVTRSHCA